MSPWTQLTVGSQKKTLRSWEEQSWGAVQAGEGP